MRCSCQIRYFVGASEGGAEQTPAIALAAKVSETAHGGERAEGGTRRSAGARAGLSQGLLAATAARPPWFGRGRGGEGEWSA